MSFQELIEKEREQRRLYILDAAEELFFAKGFSSVSMDEIAKKVGLNKATIYLYFEDKDSLFFGIVLRKIRMLHKRYEDCLKQKGSGRERVRNIGSAGFTFAQENPEFFNLLYTAGPERFKDTDNPLAKVIVELMMKELFIIRDLLKEGIADGSVRDDLDPLEMASFIVVTSRSILCSDPVWRKYLEDEGFGYQRYAADFHSFIGNALDKPQGDRKSPVKKKSTGTRKTRKSP
jgi:TetR/AcrR family transcriptional regulator